MANVRRIVRAPVGARNFYLVDACFLANKHIPAVRAPAGHERRRIEACQEWWREIDGQLAARRARVFVPDICIAEAFKVLAKKYYLQRWFRTPVELDRARKSLSRDVRTDVRALRVMNRHIRYHDISTNRDIIVGVDRFFELFLKNKKDVSVPDLILLATAKHLLEFYDIPKDLLHIVTMDRRVREGCAMVAELPRSYDPTLAINRAELVFASAV